jgi:crotonobetainyl-CoA:carnitine CoA-transferase CaiB-like acyl-CoA transferase
VGAVATTGPLAGLRIVSMAEQYPGPFANTILSDLGADVVIVERPGGGDPSRRFAPFFESLNRGRRSVCLDLKTAGGLSTLLRMLGAADVFLEGFRPGTAGRLGFGFDAVRAVNPDIVYLSVSGFGQDGPYRDRSGHDISYVALSGMLDRADGAGGPPLPPVALGDLSAGLFTTIGVLAGLLARRPDGALHVDVSMTDGLVSLMTSHLVPVVNGMGPPEFPKEPGYGVYPTADGRHLTLSVAHEDHFWRNLCRVTDMEDVADLDGDARLAQGDGLRRRLEEALGSRPLNEWLAVMEEADVPHAPVLRVDEVAADPHVRARGMLVEVPATGDRPARRHVRQPLRFGDHTGGPRGHAPRPGEHTRQVLAEYGLGADEIDTLIRQRAAFDEAGAGDGRREPGAALSA